MKKLKMIAGLLASVTVLNGSLKVSGEEYFETLKYVVCDDKVIITGFIGNPEKIVIPGKIDGKDVTEIRENAFYKCESIREIDIPDTVEVIGHHAFFQCSLLEKAELSENITEVSEGCFSECESLVSVDLPDSLKVIENDSFYNCISLSEVKFPSELESIGEDAFSGCESLKNIALGKKIATIGDYAFLGCESLERVYVPDNVVNMGIYCFGYGEDLKRANYDLVISGGENSLGKLYAENNNIFYENTESYKTQKNISPIPGVMIIFSVLGLLFLKMLKKIKLFEKNTDANARVPMNIH